MPHFQPVQKVVEEVVIDPVVVRHSVTHQEVPHIQQNIQEVPYEKAPHQQVVIDTATSLGQAVPQYLQPAPMVFQNATYVEMPVVHNVREVVNPVENEMVAQVFDAPVPAPQQEVRPYEVVEEVTAPPEVIQRPFVVQQPVTEYVKVREEVPVDVIVEKPVQYLRQSQVDVPVPQPVYAQPQVQVIAQPQPTYAYTTQVPTVGYTGLRTSLHASQQLRASYTGAHLHAVPGNFGTTSIGYGGYGAYNGYGAHLHPGFVAPGGSYIAPGNFSRFPQVQPRTETEEA